MIALVMLGGACAKNKRSIEIPLIDELPRARIVAQQNDLIKEATLGIREDARRCLFMHPVSSAMFDLVVPARAKFSFAIGVPHDVWEKPGDGVEFTVAIAQGGAEPTILFSKYLNPKSVEADREWFEEVIDLSVYEGQRITLVLSTGSGPAGDPGWDLAGWANPVVRGIWW